MKKRLILRTRTGSLAARNINSDTDPSPSWFRALSEGVGIYLGGLCHNVLTKYWGLVKKNPLQRTRAVLLASGNIYSDTDHSPNWFRTLSEGVGIYLGGLRHNVLTKYWGLVNKMPPMGTRTAFLASGNINPATDHSPDRFRALSEGVWAFIWAGCVITR